MTLYVDELILNGRIGLVNSSDKIAYNNIQIDKGMTNELTNSIIEKQQGTILGYVGRYLLYTEISLDERIYNMTFLDMAKDEKTFLEIAKSIFMANSNSDKIIAVFLRMYYQQLGHYDKIYNDVTLSIDSLPQE